MKIEVAELADCVNVADFGKPNVMGVFDRIRAPVVMPTFADYY